MKQLLLFLLCNTITAQDPNYNTIRKLKSNKGDGKGPEQFYNKGGYNSKQYKEQPQQYFMKSDINDTKMGKGVKSDKGEQMYGLQSSENELKNGKGEAEHDIYEVDKEGKVKELEDSSEDDDESDDGDDYSSSEDEEEDYSSPEDEEEDYSSPEDEEDYSSLEEVDIEVMDEDESKDDDGDDYEKDEESQVSLNSSSVDEAVSLYSSLSLYQKQESTSPSKSPKTSKSDETKSPKSEKEGESVEKSVSKEDKNEINEIYTEESKMLGYGYQKGQPKDSKLMQYSPFPPQGKGVQKEKGVQGKGYSFYSNVDDTNDDYYKEEKEIKLYSTGTPKSSKKGTIIPTDPSLLKINTLKSDFKSDELMFKANQESFYKGDKVKGTASSAYSENYNQVVPMNNYLTTEEYTGDYSDDYYVQGAPQPLQEQLYEPQQTYLPQQTYVPQPQQAKGVKKTKSESESLYAYTVMKGDKKGTKYPKETIMESSTEYYTVTPQQVPQEEFMTYNNFYDAGDDYYQAPVGGKRTSSPEYFTYNTPMQPQGNIANMQSSQYNNYGDDLFGDDLFNDPTPLYEPTAAVQKAVKKVKKHPRRSKDTGAGYSSVGTMEVKAKRKRKGKQPEPQQGYMNFMSATQEKSAKEKKDKGVTTTLPPAYQEQVGTYNFYGATNESSKDKTKNEGVVLPNAVEGSNKDKTKNEGVLPNAVAPYAPTVHNGLNTYNAVSPSPILYEKGDKYNQRGSIEHQIEQQETNIIQQKEEVIQQEKEIIQQEKEIIEQEEEIVKQQEVLVAEEVVEPNNINAQVTLLPEEQSGTDDYFVVDDEIDSVLGDGDDYFDDDAFNRKLQIINEKKSLRLG